jgi:hypothetical protein
MCKTGSKLGQMTQIFGVGDTASEKPRPVLFAGKGENDAIDAPKVFERESLVVQQSRDISLSRSAKRDERQPTATNLIRSLI